jgi:phosphatidylglycerol---prolipoprotein diacylglyceryl transferase
VFSRAAPFATNTAARSIAGEERGRPVAASTAQQAHVYTEEGMIPYLHLGPISLPTFGLMLWLAAVTAAFLVDRAFKRAGLEADAVGMVAVAVVAGIIGAKLWHVLDTPSDFRELGWHALWDQAGFAWYGGLVFGIAALVFQGWKSKIGAVRILDLAAPGAALGYGIGRIGCFLSGDGDYGIAIHPVHFLVWTFHPWGIAFPNGLVPVYVPVYPTPLYELAGGLLIGWWLWRRLGKPHATGAILGHYLLWSGLARFLVEFIRRNPKVLWGMSNAQLASVGAMIAGVGIIIWCAKQPVVSAKPAAEKASAAVQKPA